MRTGLITLSALTAILAFADGIDVSPSALAQSAPKLADGEVVKIDKDQGKMTIKHGPLQRLDMPGMTMVFRVADPKMLDQVKPGEKIKFDADRVNGAFTVTAIEKAKR